MSILKSVTLTLLVGGAAAILVFGPRAGGARPADRVVVQYWEKWVGNEGDQMKVIVDQFNDTVGKDKHIYVEYLSMSQVDRKTLIATAAGDPPDVAGLWADQIAQFGSLDALEPLDGLVADYRKGLPPGDDQFSDGYYKTVYWDACHYGDGAHRKLYGLASTPAVIALHYNKRIMHENADLLKSKGLDPDRAPRTISELDAYAAALDKIDGKTHKMVQTGYLPMEPGWYIAFSAYWFGGEIYDSAKRKLLLDVPDSLRSMQWIESYSKRLGADAVADFRSGLGNFDSAQNPFLTGAVVMEQQGPWLANYIKDLKPEMSNKEWAGMDFRSQSESSKAAFAKYMALSIKERQDLADWAVAPFPTEQPEGANPDTGTAYCPFDVLVIPSTSHHKKEAFEFLAFVNRRDVMEHLCQMHCKNTPLAKTSDTWLKNHPNPYIEVFDRLASSPHARAVPSCPVWPEIFDEITSATQAVALLKEPPSQALSEAQQRMQAKIDDFYRRQDLRKPAHP